MMLMPLYMLMLAAILLTGCLCFAKNAGQFQSKAEDLVPELPLERYLNEMIVTAQFGVDASVPVVTPVPTGMQRQHDLGDVEKWEGRKWVLYGCVWGPTNFDNGWGPAIGDVAMRVQLRYPDTPATMYGRDNRNVIAQSTRELIFLTSGAAKIDWPVPMAIMAPKPVLLAPNLEIVMVGTDAAVLNDDWYTFHLLYGWAHAFSGDLIASLQQRAT